MYQLKLKKLSEQLFTELKSKELEEESHYKEIEKNLLKILDEGEEPLTYSVQIPMFHIENPNYDLVIRDSIYKINDQYRKKHEKMMESKKDEKDFLEPLISKKESISKMEGLSQINQISGYFSKKPEKDLGLLGSNVGHNRINGSISTNMNSMYSMTPINNINVTYNDKNNKENIPRKSSNITHNKVNSYNKKSSIYCELCKEAVKEVRCGRYGLLMNCDHVFCLQCIKEFRKPKKYETEVAIYNKHCPTCKVFSDIIIPSFVFTTKKEEKDKMGEDYKQSMSKIECKYEKKDRKCPFSKECFYFHNMNFTEKGKENSKEGNKENSKDGLKDCKYKIKEKDKLAEKIDKKKAFHCVSHSHSQFQNKEAKRR